MIEGILEFPIVPYYRAVRLSRKIDGWLTNGEARFLFAAARLVTPQNIIVEVGAWFGKSTVLLIRGSQSGHHAAVYSFDLFQVGGNDAEVYAEHVKDDETYLAVWQKNVRRAGGTKLAHPVVGCSWEEADRISAPVGFLFVDGDHSEDGVRNDWNAVSPHLADKAVVMFHDYLNESTSVRKVVEEIRHGWNFGVVGASAVLWR